MPANILNVKLFRSQINTMVRRNKNYAQMAYTTIARPAFEKEKIVLINEFNDNPVTKELEAGESASTLTLSKGNLFSFIGFYAGQDVIGELREALIDNVGIDARSYTTKYLQNAIEYRFKVFVPTTRTLANATPTPTWMGGTWLDYIELGIPNFESYVFNLEGFPSSRSNTGLQAKNPITTQQVGPIRYVKSMLADFIQKFK